MGIPQDLIRESRLYRRSQDYRELLAFIARLPNFAPFNAWLLRVQKPGLRFAATAHDWNSRFQRTVNEGARPLIVLRPFAAVGLVYDVADTDGKPLPADLAVPFRAKGGVTRQLIDRFGSLLGQRGIQRKALDFGDGLAGHVRRFEVGRRSVDKKTLPDYRVRVNANHYLNVQFTTLTHELGHLFLGHLGPDAYLRIAERPPLSHAQREIEAESVAYLVCSRHGVIPNAETYLAGLLRDDGPVPDLDTFWIIKAAGQVEAALGIARYSSLGK